MSCIPLIDGNQINTGTDSWPGILGWNDGYWHSSNVRGIIGLSAGTKTVQWQCKFYSGCTGSVECNRFAVVLTGPYS